MLLAIGVLLAGAGLVLLVDIGGAGSAVIRRVTSRSLGDLAPGFAASRSGFNVYASLVLAIGVAVIGLGAIAQWPELTDIGALTFGLGVVIFVGASVIAIVGEVRTYRALKR